MSVTEGCHGFRRLLVWQLDRMDELIVVASAEDGEEDKPSFCSCQLGKRTPESIFFNPTLYN